MNTDPFSRAGNEQAHSDEGSLRPAVARLFFENPVPEGPAKRSGRFDLTSVSVRGSSDPGGALTTCLLVLYPAFASAAVVIAGLLLSGTGAAS